ncbi:hypothetical protein AB0C59_14930 [Streptomyces sp. NPDC048664]|uniref:hypothetical protein n=1 Tax=Streptomyces sp. NPDC048664 TaxID=3154505 RepID=UPI00343F419F
MSDGTHALQARRDGQAQAAADSPDDCLERLLRSLDESGPEPRPCDGYAVCGDWPW